MTDMVLNTNHKGATQLLISSLDRGFEPALTTFGVTPNYYKFRSFIWGIIKSKRNRAKHDFWQCHRDSQDEMDRYLTKEGN